MKRSAILFFLILALMPTWASLLSSADSQPSALQGQYIGAVPGEGRAPLLRKTFTVKDAKSAVVLRVNSLGYHEAYLNGVKVSDYVLTPAVSQLNKRSLVVSYDVTGMLRKGQNELVVWAGSGWYKPKTFGAQYEGPLVKAELCYSDPSAHHPSLIVCTDGSWQGTWSGYSDRGTWEAHKMGGELIDARIVPTALSAASLDKMAWQPVDVVRVEGMEVSPQLCEPCRVQETLEPASIVADGEGRFVVDFGRIVNGMIELTLPQMAAGDTTKVSFSDVRRDDGSFYFVTADRYIASGRSGGDHFESRFNHHVFRYVVVDFPKNDNISHSFPTPFTIKARRMRTDFRRTAWFESSDEELNRIHDMVAYTLENLAFNGYMVDCANIERLGYGGDGNASTQTLQTLFDVERLYDNWLMAWRDVIHPDGSLPHTAPAPYFAGGGPYWCSFVVQAPWRTYMNYGHEEVLRENYPTMKLWLQYVDKYTIDGLLKKWPDQPDRWWYLGDWAAPKGTDVNVQDEQSVDLVNNCALCQVYLQLEQIARILGKEADAKEFQRRYTELTRVIQQTFYHPESATYGTGSQIDMVYPMLVGVTPKSERGRVVQSLKARTEQLYKGHLVTGLVGIPVLTEWATLHHEADWMYSMLKQHDYPGYLYMLDNGASGTWEHWNGERSLLHNCYNGIGSWFYQALGGIIADEPGYRHVTICPQVPQGLEWVNVTQDTPQGKIVVRRNGRQLHVELPEGITANIFGKEYTAGSYDLVMPQPLPNKAQQVVRALNDPTTDYVVVVAHRGDWRNYPENSLAAIESVIGMGVDIMELDLKLTKDSILVLSHDETLDRCTTGSGKISDYTYDELLRFDLKRGHGIAIPGMKIPTLRQALQLCKDRIVVNVDQGYGYYDLVLAITEELGMTDQVLIKSGSPYAAVRKKFAQHAHNMMYMPVVGISSAGSSQLFDEYINDPQPPMAFELCFGSLDEAVRAAARRVVEGGSKVWVNTIWGSLCGNYDDDRAFDTDRPDNVYGTILDLGTSIIQTDRPEFLIKYLEEKGRRNFEN